MATNLSLWQLLMTLLIPNDEKIGSLIAGSLDDKGQQNIYQLSLQCLRPAE
jgi:hypothetical protein